MKKRILLMDDQQMLRDAAGLMLKSLGYEAALVADGQAAVDIYRQAMESGRKFDLVILDLVIPGGIGGIEVVQMLRQLDPEVLTVISSGYTNDPAVLNYARYGFDDVLSKPYSLTELGDKLRSLLTSNS